MDNRRRPGLARVIRIFGDGMRELEFENGRRVRVKFRRCPGCKIERPESNFTMALCIECQGVEIRYTRGHECDKGGGTTPRYYQSKRYAAKAVATPPWVNKKDILSVYAEARRLSKETGKPHHVDHIWPLVHEDFCGLHVPWNLRIIEKTANLTKGNKPPLDYFQASRYIP